MVAKVDINKCNTLIFFHGSRNTYGGASGAHTNPRSVKICGLFCIPQGSMKNEAGSTWEMEEVAACQAMASGLGLSLDWAPSHLYPQVRIL